jgi:hypothetical protein
LLGEERRGEERRREERSLYSLEHKHHRLDPRRGTILQIDPAGNPCTDLFFVVVRLLLVGP